MTESLRLAGKEFRAYFATPAAYLFLGAFLAAGLFVVFWVEAFFARNIADVRPLFQWLPLLLILLVAALTMRSWSEERRAGTLESLLTAPVHPLQLILGKFIAALGLVALAVALTLPLPLSVALIGPLDWGPVIGGYVATLFLAAAYVAIGLCMSARTDNPVVALIVTSLACGLLYLLGADTLTTLFGHGVGGALALLGSGTRFQSITRGVLDLRDLYYYVSLVGVFLALNLYGLERLRWAGNPASAGHRRRGWIAALTAANLLAANLWLAPIGWARLDLTAGRVHSLSEATTAQLATLREPLLIRGYFSDRTHPLLAPLIPQVKDLLQEYALAADGRARVEFIDPTRDRAAEEEAAARYGVRPVPLQTASRYQAAVVSSYFDVVVAYGDQVETLGYEDLIEAKMRSETDIDVVLNNPEYAITRAIRKAVSAYQGGGNPFDTLQRPVTFRGYLSPDAQLPEALRLLRGELEAVLAELGTQAGERLQVHFDDPDAGDGSLGLELQQRYGFVPQIASLADPRSFWFYMLLEGDGETVQVPMPETLDREALKRSLIAGLQRLAPGFLKTVAIARPQGFGLGAKRYTQLEEVLSENVRLRDTDLSSGQVPDDADLLLVLAPEALDARQRYAIDQFLMRGGSVVLATSPYDVQVTQTLNARAHDSGLEDWLAGHGIDIAPSMVLDPRNAALPVPVERSVGGLLLQEIRMLPYPHFPDLRADGMAGDNPITAALGQLTVNWASPIVIDPERNRERRVSELLRSSDGSWTSDSLQVIPDYARYPDSGFEAFGERASRLLAVAIEGRFDSAYAGQPSPLMEAALEAQTPDTADASPTEPTAATPTAGVIERSPDSARLIVIASNTFGTDAALDLASQGLGVRYTKPAEFLQNAIDWSLEDRSLLALRGRTQLARTLLPLPEAQQRMWEYMNYALALLGVLAVWGWRRYTAAADRLRYQRILAEV